VRVFERDVPLLLRGETGGKEAFAQAVHQASARRHKPFVALNCASIPESLIESELFGYRGGSFTGARKEGMRGKLQQADGGTCCSTRSATCRWRCRPACGCWKSVRWCRLAASRKLDAIISATHRDLLERVERQLSRRPLLPPQWPGGALPALRERSDKGQLLDFWARRPKGRR
jgi:transcriptional regulator of acetoin/glycerol metabolism